MTNHASYIITTYSALLSISEDQIIQIGNNQFEDSNPIPSFDENLLINLCEDVRKIFENEENVLSIEGDVIIVGDIHGSFHDLLRILRYISNNPSKVVFLGDYVDRGCFSLECITLLFALKVLYPDKYFLLRGNHEFDTICSMYGFKKEILNYHNPMKMINNKPKVIPIHNITYINFDEELDDEFNEEESPEVLCDNYVANHINLYCYKYSVKLYESFLEAFSYLPIAAVVNNTTLCLHGGLTPQLEKIDKIKKLIQRPIYNFDENELLTDILWGDPSTNIRQSYADNPRGRGKLFNSTALYNFLKINNLKRLVRAHECVLKGFNENFGDKCITVFSASSYNRDMGNKSGVVRLFQKDDKVEIVSFEPFHRLKKIDTIYYRVQPFSEESGVKPFCSCFNIKKITSCNPVQETKKSDTNSNLYFSIKKESDLISNYASFRAGSNGSRRASFGPTFTFNTGLRHRKHVCSSLDVSSDHSVIPKMRHSRTENYFDVVDRFKPNLLENQTCLPTLDKKRSI